MHRYNRERFRQQVQVYNQPPANDQGRARDAVPRALEQRARSALIKSTMQMHDLRCKTPELVRKEIWMHVLTISSALSWLKPRRHTTSCHARSALRAPCKPWKHFTR
jgi:hypothetical protein